MLKKTALYCWILALMTHPPLFAAQAKPAGTSTAEPARVAQARIHRGQAVTQLLAQHKIAPEKLELFLRAFKKEATLEVWGRNRGDPRFTLIKSYPVCAASGVLGPKRQQGDSQVPEGFYFIDRFNPYSNFHLSLGLNYPNREDRQRATAAKIGNPGGDIFIHGNCVSIGCLAMGDAAIEEIYLLALTTQAAQTAQTASDPRFGQVSKKITVHIFPSRLDASNLAALEKTTRDPSLLAFWRGLQPTYEYFERTRDLPGL